MVDCAGRAHVLQKQLRLEKTNRIRHGASFLWVDGLLNYETLTDSTPRQIRLNPQRAQHRAPAVLARDQSFPGRGAVALGDSAAGHDQSGPRLRHARDRARTGERPGAPRAVDLRALSRLRAGPAERGRFCTRASYRDFSFDAVQTIDRNRWAMVGEAGRWSDPLYSPGGDVIAIYNTLVCDSILTADQAELDAKVPLYEQLERAVYAAYLPSFPIGYDCLGDQEVHSLKYVWELTIYFAFYVFPFINDLFTDRRFLDHVPADVHEARSREPRAVDDAQRSTTTGRRRTGSRMPRRSSSSSSTCTASRSPSRPSTGGRVGRRGAHGSGRAVRQRDDARALSRGAHPRDGAERAGARVEPVVRLEPESRRALVRSVPDGAPPTRRTRPAPTATCGRTAGTRKWRFASTRRGGRPRPSRARPRRHRGHSGRSRTAHRARLHH